MGNGNAKNILMYSIVREQNLLRKSNCTKEMNGVYKTRNKNSKQISAKMFSIHFHQKMKVKASLRFHLILVKVIVMKKAKDKRVPCTMLVWIEDSPHSKVYILSDFNILFSLIIQKAGS